MDTLHGGASLSVDQALQSNNGRYRLLMQGDGNLVLYEGQPSVASAVWATNTVALPDEDRPVRADMQQDGNFVLYSLTNKPVWATGTDGHPGSRLVVQDDRRLVIYDARDQPLWASASGLGVAPPTVHVAPRPVPLGGDYWGGGYDIADDGLTPVWGIADMHAHPLSHLGFGGRLFWGRPDGPIEQALAWCDAAHGPGGTGLFVTTNPLTAALIAFIEGGPGHLVGGFPAFDGWPRFTSLVHQKMYVDWIRRAYDGGLRLMVALVVNNELLASASEGRNYDDRSAVEGQIRGIKDLVARHPAFMEVAYTPRDARQIIGDNRLAVVLGVEVDSLGNWGREGDASVEEVRAYLNYLHRELGVRHIFPIHLANNAFGGTAVYNDLFNVLNQHLRGESFRPRTAAGLDFRLGSSVLAPFLAPAYPDVPGAHANELGLTATGAVAVEEMMRIGMLIDVDHMSEAAVSATLAIAERRDYPVVAGHTAFWELASVRDEYQRTTDQLARIRRLGGIVAVGLHQSELRQRDSRVANDAPGSSKSWARAYLYACERMGGSGVAVGTDINGFAGTVGPRFGLNACYDERKQGGEADTRAHARRAHVYAQANGVRYDSPIRDYRAYRFEGALEGDVYDMEERDIWEAIAIFKSGTHPDQAEMPGPLRRTWWQNDKIKDIAKGFCATSESELENPLFGGNTYNEQRAAFLVAHAREPDQGDEVELKRLHGVIKRIWERWHAMEGGNRPLSRGMAGRRDFDINLDGVAHYGLLPDFFQDCRNAGLTQSDFAPLFRSAEDYIRTWEKCERRKDQRPRDSVFVSQSVPATLSPGEAREVSVTMRNTGTLSWSGREAYRLGSQDPRDRAWGLTRVELAGDTPPGGEATFIFSVRAPNSPGAYMFRWRMLQEGVEWFGDLTPATSVTVPEPAECDSLRATMAAKRDEVAGLQAELETAATGEKPRIIAGIRRAGSELSRAEQRANELGCAPS